jgi:2-keto-4-pentenoate hydratase/2-oxohepta-3-ene-1,7-dioic acid hydratase in catechol pathway
MKIIRYSADGAAHVGVLESETLVPLAGFADTRDLIAGGAAALDAARKAVAAGAGRRPLSGVKLLAPIVPFTILCSGSNYTDHNKEKANTPISGKEPEFFVKTADCVIGPEDTIVHDEKLCKKLDCETELAIVIGKPGRHIPVEHALEHVFGYTIVNDVTARDRQVRTNAQGFTWYELGRGKAFDTSAPLGPCITTADEIGDPQKLRLRTRINGELRQSSSTGNMIFDCAHLIHFFSSSFTLKPGMVIITGTPGGTAWSTDPELGGKWVGGDGSEPLVPAKGYLKPGDVIECELEKIGVLRNRVGTGG